ncbi:MAG: CvpA family protein [Chloroflexota bacterium]
MISLSAFFWILVGFFSLAGLLRGWTKEILSTFGLVLSLFALDLLAPRILGLLGQAAGSAGQQLDPLILRRQQFLVLSLIHLVISFFSYQGPALAGQITGGRLNIPSRRSLQERLLGGIMGGINGYLVIGTFWAFLEYQITADGYQRLFPGELYPFAQITRPDPNSPAWALASRLPLPLLAPYLPFIMVAVALFVIVVLV